jgi:hypothetical protein
MSNEPERNQRTFWTPPTEPSSNVPGDDLPGLEPARGKTIFPAPKRRTGRERPDADVVAFARVADEEGLQRVGRRRRVRPELALIAVGLIFLAGALIKPWPSPARTPSASPLPTTPTAQDSPDLIALQPSDVQIGIPGDVVQGWSSVDWGLLGGTDPHSAWGLAVAVMPSLTDGLIAPEVTSPMSSWVAAGTSPYFATTRLTHGLSPYAIAVTWPGDVKVTSVTFQYLNGPDYPINVRPPGFPEFAQVSPVPADAVATPPASSPSIVSPSAVPASGSPASEMPAAAGSALESGRFWIPPSDASLSAVSDAPSTADWQVLPWPWPIGSYWVRVTTTTGTKIILFQIQQG